MAKVSATILGADLLHIEEEVEKVKTADFLHYDVMDGHFVPNLTYGNGIYDQIRDKFPKLRMDVHLMVKDCDKLIPLFKEADIITFHLPSTNNPAQTIKEIKKHGSKVGIALNPDEEFEMIEKYSNEIDLILVLGAFAGLSGQKFRPETIDKVRRIRDKFKGLLEVDCGVNGENAKDLVEAGIDILVSSSFLFEKDTTERLAYLKSL